MINNNTPPKPLPPDHTVPILNENETLIRKGDWETELCCCLGANCGAFLNCFMAWCLPCVSIAQVSQRMGYINYWIVLLVLGVLGGGWYAVMAAIGHNDDYLTSYQLEIYTRSYKYIYKVTKDRELNVEDRTYFDLGIVLVMYNGMWAFMGLVAAILMVLAVWFLRFRMRQRFHIPGLCCLDFWVAFVCPCLAVAQLANHVKIHKKRGCNIGPVDTIPAYTQHQ